MSTWVVGDIHGMYNTFQNLLKRLDLKEADKVILVGDIIDRGDDSYKMLKWAMENVTEDGKYQMILGNHENEVIQHYYQIIGAGSEYGYTEETGISELYCDYGFETYMLAEGFETIGSIKPFVEWFETLPLYKRISVTKLDGTEQKYVIAHAWFDRKEIKNKQTLLWTRDVDPHQHYINKGFGPDYDGDDNEILIHGHTPVSRDNGYPEDAVVYFREHSINIDCGACFMKDGGRLAAFRLEDQKVIYA